MKWIARTTIDRMASKSALLKIVQLKLKPKITDSIKSQETTAGINSSSQPIYIGLLDFSMNDIRRQLAPHVFQELDLYKTNHVSKDNSDLMVLHVGAKTVRFSNLKSTLQLDVNNFRISASVYVLPTATTNVAHNTASLNAVPLQSFLSTPRCSSSTNVKRDSLTSNVRKSDRQSRTPLHSVDVFGIEMTTAPSHSVFVQENCLVGQWYNRASTGDKNGTVVFAVPVMCTSRDYANRRRIENHWRKPLCRISQHGFKLMLSIKLSADIRQKEKTENCISIDVASTSVDLTHSKLALFTKSTDTYELQLTQQFKNYLDHGSVAHNLMRSTRADDHSASHCSIKLDLTLLDPLLLTKATFDSQLSTITQLDLHNRALNVTASQCNAFSDNISKQVIQIKSHTHAIMFLY